MFSILASLYIIVYLLVLKALLIDLKIKQNNGPYTSFYYVLGFTYYKSTLINNTPSDSGSLEKRKKALLVKE